jgi:charged multivesicular body protein 3
MQAGIIEEMMEETMDILEDQDELEEEAQEEVDKVNVLMISAMISVKVK